ncbi:MAG: ATP-binding protein [Desulfosarcina sp.]
MHIRSIGVRLTAWYMGLLTLTFLVLGTAAYGLLSYSLSRDMDSSLKGIADVMAQSTRSGGKVFSPSDVDNLFRRFFGFSPLDRYLDLVDPRGQRDPDRSRPDSGELPISAEALKNASQGGSTFETIETPNGYPMRVLTLPVIDAGRVSNLVQVGMSLENMIITRRRFLLIMASVLPLCLLLAGGGGWLLARRSLRPVEHMTRSAQRISADHLDQRLELTGSGDELDRLAKTLNDMLDRLDNAFHQIRQFSADASHELQTPLTILKGEMEVALRSGRSPEEYQMVLKSGLEEIDRMNYLVGGLLLLARADTGVLRLDRQQVDLRSLVHETCKQIRVIADEHSIALQSDLPEAVSIRGDQEHLRRLMLNLCDNAIKYTPAGGSVTVSLQSTKDWVSLKITDTGIGLSQTEMQQVFSRFHRVTESRSKDVMGVGLGLSIARSIAEAHGGRIDVESTPGLGSTFTVQLPINFSPNIRNL